MCSLLCHLTLSVASGPARYKRPQGMPAQSHSARVPRAPRTDPRCIAQPRVSVLLRRRGAVSSVALGSKPAMSDGESLEERIQRHHALVTQKGLTPEGVEARLLEMAIRQSMESVKVDGEGAAARVAEAAEAGAARIAAEREAARVADEAEAARMNPGTAPAGPMYAWRMLRRASTCLKSTPPRPCGMRSRARAGTGSASASPSPTLRPPCCFGALRHTARMPRGSSRPRSRLCTGGCGRAVGRHVAAPHAGRSLSPEQFCLAVKGPSLQSALTPRS